MLGYLGPQPPPPPPRAQNVEGAVHISHLSLSTSHDLDPFYLSRREAPPHVMMRTPPKPTAAQGEAQILSWLVNAFKTQALQ